MVAPLSLDGIQWQAAWVLHSKTLVPFPLHSLPIVLYKSRPHWSEHNPLHLCQDSGHSSVNNQHDFFLWAISSLDGVLFYRFDYKFNVSPSIDANPAALWPMTWHVCIDDVCFFIGYVFLKRRNTSSSLDIVATSIANSAIAGHS